MDLYLPRAVEWVLMVQEFTPRGISGEIRWFQAVEIIGFNSQTVRCRCQLYEECG